MLLAGAPVFAECEYKPGDIIQLPQITTEITSDYTYGDGNISYLYCLYEAIDGEGNTIYSENYAFDGGLNNPCPAEQLEMNLSYRNNSFFAMIYSADMINEGQGWKPLGSMANILNQTEDTYNACYPPPSPEFMQALMEYMLQFICSLFPSFSFCQG